MDNQIIDQNGKKKSGIIKMVGALIVIALAGFAWAKTRNPNITPVNTNSNLPLSGMDSEPMMNNRKYKDGTYSATGNYVSPNGPESIAITLVLKDDVITSTTFKSNATHATSMKMQGLFSQGFNTLVVGKSLDDVSLIVVNGSSLTPKGFMDALSKIKLEAKA